MSLDSLDQSLKKEIEDLQAEGRAKKPERIITGYVPGRNGHGPRYLLDSGKREFLRLNSNSYLSLSHHPALIAAAEEAGREFGAGPARCASSMGPTATTNPSKSGSPGLPGNLLQRYLIPPIPPTAALPLPLQPRRCAGSETSSITTASSGPCASPMSPVKTKGYTAITTWTLWRACWSGQGTKPRGWQ